jgi:HEAT repeat protein
MGAARQLDLFSQYLGCAERRSLGNAAQPAIAVDRLADDGLVAALATAGMRDTIVLAAEAGRRRLAAAVPILEEVCRRFAGFGLDRIVPEQMAALDAIAVIGGGDAARALVRLIAIKAVQGPGLRQTVGAAANLGARLPADMVLGLLRNGDPQIRADACRCTRAWPEATPVLRELLDDLHRPVRMAAACALGRMGRTEARPLLLCYLREVPSAELIDAIVPLADEECLILLGQIARGVPHLCAAALDALDATYHPRAEKIATHVRENWQKPGWPARSHHQNGKP